MSEGWVGTNCNEFSNALSSIYMVLYRRGN